MSPFLDTQHARGTYTWLYHYCCRLCSSERVCEAAQNCVGSLLSRSLDCLLGWYFGGVFSRFHIFQMTTAAEYVLTVCAYAKMNRLLPWCLKAVWAVACGATRGRLSCQKLTKGCTYKQKREVGRLFARDRRGLITAAAVRRGVVVS